MGAEALSLPEVPGFRLVRKIGRGGMGEVFHAVRVGPGGFRKDVALKQLVADQSLSGRARERFFEEARVSAQLDHGNLVRVHDVVTAGASCFIVMELLRGANLVEAANVLRDPKLALAVAAQALEGLAYAHDAVDGGRPLGLVHRDLTPRNVFVCGNGVVKILDFGIARRQNAPQLTSRGQVKGTLSFLSPEQARGETVDRRSDLYQIGGILYWLLGGTTPHGDGTPGEIIARAASATPQPLADVPTEVAALVARAMARDPSARFQTAPEMKAAVLAAGPADTRALAAAIDALPARDDDAPVSQTISETGESTAAAAPVRAAEPVRTRRRWPWLAGVAIALVAAGIVAGRFTRATTSARVAHWQRLTFGSGRIGGARFAPGGNSFVYAAAWNNEPMQLYSSVAGNAVGRALGIRDADLLAVSARGDLLVQLHPHNIDGGFTYAGTLARVPLAGGAPRELVTDVADADFGPDGEPLAVIRWQPAGATVEFPIGTKRAATSAFFTHLRVSPDGNHVAFLARESKTDSRGRVMVLDRSGPPRAIGELHGGVTGIVWTADGRLRISDARSLVELTLDGASRELLDAPSGIRIADLGRDGNALVVTEELDSTSFGDLAGDGRATSLDALHGRVFALSPDGKQLLVTDVSGDIDSTFGVYVAPADGSGSPVRISRGIGRGFSRDGTRAVVMSAHENGVSLVPIGAGSAVELPLGPIDLLEGITWFPDGKRLLYSAVTAGVSHVYEIGTDGSAPVAIGRAGLGLGAAEPASAIVSADSRTALVVETATQTTRLLDLHDGSDRAAPGVRANELASWMPDGHIAAYPLLTAEVDIAAIDPATGERKPLKRISARERAGVMFIFLEWVSPDLSRYIATETYARSTLQLVEGLP